MTNSLAQEGEGRLLNIIFTRLFAQPLGQGRALKAAALRIHRLVPCSDRCGTQKYCQPPNAVQKTRFLPRKFLFLAAALFLIPTP
jgi:hypothetical protein